MQALPHSSREELQAGFTDNQWYCHLARQTVFFSAFSDQPVDLDSAMEMARNITALAPHLLTGFDGGIAGQPLSEEILRRIISISDVDELDGYPDSWSMAGDDIFDSSDLPLFRIRIARRKAGADANGNHAAVLILSTHSLFEGADASRLSRSLSVERAEVTAKPPPVSATRQFAYRALASVLAPLQIAAASLVAPRRADVGFKSLVLDRAKLRRLAGWLDISQQSLMFALASYALNDAGRGFSRRSITTLYADLSRTSEFQTNDSFFQFRMIDLKLPYVRDFPAYAKGVDEAVSRAEAGDKAATQMLLGAMFGMHRWLHARLPFLYTAKLFRFSAGYDMTLSLVPPQRMGGSLTRGLVEPVYSGTCHPGFNMCVFAPGRKYVTFSLSLRARHLKNAHRIEELFNSLVDALEDEG